MHLIATRGDWYIMVECWSGNRQRSVSIPFQPFSFYQRRPSPLSCINEYLAIDGGGNVIEWYSRYNCCVARMLPREVELVPE